MEAAARPAKRRETARERRGRSTTRVQNLDPSHSKSSETPKPPVLLDAEWMDGTGGNGGRAWRGRGEERGPVAGLEGALSRLAMQDLVVLLSAVVDVGW